MASWRVAKSLDVLLRQVNEHWPARDKSSDGTIGDAAHAARESDHNPNSDGVVCARDITHDPAHGFDSYAFADMLLRAKDERIKYVISNRRIASGTGQSNPAWVWRPYSGANAHDHHVHISVKGDPAHYDNTALWNIDMGTVPGPVPVTPTLPPIPLPPSVPARPMLQSGNRGPDVRMLQELLFVDGIFGPETEEALIAFQKSKGLDGDGIVGPDTWQELLKGTPVAPPPNVPPVTTGRQVGIIATVFGGAGDLNKSAYSGKLLNDSDWYVALPYRFQGARPLVWVENAEIPQRVDLIPIEDVGPWNTDDDYWVSERRPQAESGTDERGRKTNLAGIDLSPGLAKRIGISGKGKVNWGFANTITTPAKSAEPDAPKPSPASSWMDFDIWGWLKGFFK